MRILQINAVYEYSSTGRTTTEMHEYMLAHGIDSYVAAPNIKVPKERLIRIGSPISLRLHSLLSRITGLQGYFSYFSTRRLIKKIERINPDVIHLRNLHSNFINLPLLLKYIASKDLATVLTLHDFWFMTGHCCYFTDTNCDKWTKECGHCPDMSNWNKSWFFDTSRKCLIDKKRQFGNIRRLAVIGVSDWVTRHLEYSILKDALIRRTIYNWIDTDRFKPQDTIQLREKLGIKDDFVVLGVAQNWTKTKGLSDFVAVAKAHPDYKILLVGNIVDKTIVLPSNMITVGVAKSTEELIEYYSMADVFFNPTLRETFGKVTIEAQACGTPVVAYDVTATSELVLPGCGYLTKPHDMTEVLSCLEKICKGGKNQYTTKCRETAVAVFSRSTLMRQYVELYKELINA